MQKDIIIIPTYNEKMNIKRLIPWINELQPHAFILVVDDNSPDGTAEEVRRLRSRYPNVSLLLRSGKEGLGKAYIHAFEMVLQENSVNKIVTMDADLSHDPRYLNEMLENAEHYGCVIGSRYVSDGKTCGWELWRRILSRYGNFYCRLVTRMPVYDCTSGYHVIQAQWLKKIDFSRLDLSGYAFLIQLKYLLWKAGAGLKEIPIVFQNRTGGESKISGHIISEGLLAPWKLVLQHARLHPLR